MIANPAKRAEQTQFFGMDLDADPAQLAPGYYPLMRNMEPWGSYAKMRDYLKRLTQQQLPNEIVGLAQAFFASETYGRVILVVDIMGDLYWLNGDTWTLLASGLFTGAPVVRSAQLGGDLAMIDGTNVVRVYVRKTAGVEELRAEAATIRPSPPKPLFYMWEGVTEFGWWTLPQYLEARDINSVTKMAASPDMVPAAAFRYCMTFVWPDGTEGPVSPISEPFLWTALGWTGTTLNKVGIEIPSYTIPEYRPLHISLYRSHARFLDGMVGEPFTAFYHVGDIPIGVERYADSITISSGDPPGVTPMSSIPAADYITVAGDPERLVIAKTKELTEQQPESGEVLQAIVWEGVNAHPWTVPAATFRYRARLRISSNQGAMYGGSVSIRLQNQNSNVGWCSVLEDGYQNVGIGGYISDTYVPDFRNLVNASGAGYETKIAFTEIDGRTRIPFRVDVCEKQYMAIELWLPQVLMGVGADVYMYFDETLAQWQEAPAQGYLGRRTSGTDDEEVRIIGMYCTALTDDDPPLTKTGWVASGPERQCFWPGGPMDRATTVDYDAPFDSISGQSNDSDYRRRTALALRISTNTFTLSRSIADLDTGAIQFIWHPRGDDSTDDTWAVSTIVTLDHATGTDGQIQAYVTGGNLRIRVNGFATGATPYAELESLDDWYYVTVTWDKPTGRVAVYLTCLAATTTFNESAEHTDGVDMDTDSLKPILFAGTGYQNTDAELADFRLRRRYVTADEHRAAARFKPDPYYSVMVDSNVEDLQEITEHPNRVRWSDPGDALSWPVLGYRDIGSEGQPLTGLASYKGHIIAAKEVGVWPIQAITGRTFEFLEGSQVEETIVWNPQQVKPEEKGFAGCSVPGGLLATPDGVWMISGARLLRYDLQRFWDHSAGIRAALIGAGTALTNPANPGRVFYYPMRHQLLIAWYAESEWKILCLNKFAHQGQDRYGWCWHYYYSPSVIGQTIGSSATDLLMGDGQLVYTFDHTTITDDIWGAGIPPFVLRTPTTDFVRGMVKGVGCSFKNEERVACDVWYRCYGQQNFQRVKRWPQMRSDRQYPCPKGAVHGAYFEFEDAEGYYAAQQVEPGDKPRVERELRRTGVIE